MTINLNRVTITGYLAQDPELIDLAAGQQACELRIACNRRRQHRLTGRWEEWADFFDARIVGGLAPIAHRRLRTPRHTGLVRSAARRRTPGQLRTRRAGAPARQLKDSHSGGIGPHQHARAFVLG